MKSRFQTYHHSYVMPLVVFVLLLTSCQNIKEVQCTGVKGFKVNKINTEGINGDIMLSIKNPNAFGFSIYKSEFDIIYSGVYLGKAKLTKRVHINAKAENTYCFNLANSFKDVNLVDVMKLLSGATFKNLIEVKGSLRVGKMCVKKKFPIDLKEKITLE